ncbi:MAG: hypothetical protein KY460_15675 [Actinobacteria bacterium]|nr:hypothetical protein [Actinomycetota bacterium]
MEWLYALLPLLGCAAMMAVCMKMMGGMGNSSGEAADDKDSDALRARITELERRLEVESGQATADDGTTGQPAMPSRGE